MADAIPAAYKTDEGLRTLANYLRSQNGIKGRSGIEHEKRIDYFKGKRLVECIIEGKKWPKSLPPLTDKGIIQLVADRMIQASFFHRSEKIEEKKGHFKISQRNIFEENGYYTWMYAGNMVWSNLLTGLVIAVVIGFTLLPIWPDAAKKILWYCSVTFLIATLSFCMVRFVLFLILWILGYDFWIFPRLFDESLSFQDSFKPIYTFDKASAGQGYYRMGSLLTIVGFVYWACTQPTEFDGFIKAQKEFIDDLYSGNLLADVAHNTKEHMDRNNKVPNMADLIREMEAEALAEKAAEMEEEEGKRSPSSWVDSAGGEDREGDYVDASDRQETESDEQLHDVDIDVGMDGMPTATTDDSN